MPDLTNVTFRDRATELAGTLRLPSARLSSGVVFIHGSGTLDRDDWYGWPEQLADGGIGTLAYDKQGCGTSGGDWTAQNLEDRAAEALAALRFLGAQPRIDPTRVGLLGLSQGSWVAPLAASMSKDVAFVISLSGAGVSPAEQEAYRVEQAVTAQEFSADVAAAALTVFRRRLELLGSGSDVEEIWLAEEAARDEPWFSLLGGATRDRLGFLLRIYHFDPVFALVRTSCPLLAVWGDRDILVPVERSVKAFKDALTRGHNRCFDLRVLHGVDHELQLVSATSAVEKAAFASQLVEDLVAWVRALTVDEIDSA